MTTLCVAFAALLGALVAAPAPRAAPGTAGGRTVLDRVVAVVNDDVVLHSELRKATDGNPLFHEALSKLPANATVEQREKVRHDVEARVLDELIDMALIRAEAVRFEVKIADADVDRALHNIAQNNQMTVETLRKEVEASDAWESWDDYREQLRDQILIHHVSQILANWSVSEAQVREHYRKLTRDESAKVEVEHFLFTPKSTAKADRDRAFTLAQRVARRMRAGETADEVAKAIDYKREVQRTIGRGDVAPAIEEALFAAQEKAIVGPLGSGQGYAVFRVVTHVESGALSYEEAKDNIRAQLESEAAVKADADMRTQLRAKAHIDVRL